jgi:AcrR family transcriptional regulator
MKRTATATTDTLPAAPRRGAASNTLPGGRKRASGRSIGADPGSALSTTDKIVEAATELFASHGYVHTTLDDVAALAGFSKGAVYYYFKDKETLLIEVLKRIQERSIETTVAGVKAHGGPAAEQLKVFVKYQTGWAARYPRDLALLMLMSAETANTSARLRMQMIKIYRKLASALEEIVEEGKRTGEFKTTQETRDTVLYLQAVHDGNMMIWYRSGTDPEIGRRLAKVTLSGFLRTVMD